MVTKLKDFKTRKFWKDNITCAEAAVAMSEAEKFLHSEKTNLNNKLQTCQIFEFPRYRAIYIYACVGTTNESNVVLR